ncbi:MAG: hypothetical protein AAF501_13410 [Pseudomonadota bacterium]
MRIITGLIALCLAGHASAEEARLSGSAISDLLTGATVIGERTEQVFYESGRTLYNDGQDSWGYWRTQGDRYCSQWPPSESWVCYDMVAETAGGVTRVVWIGDSGTRYEGKIKR